MTTTINASTSTGLVNTADTSGILKVQSNGVTTNSQAWGSYSYVNGTSVPTKNSSYNITSITLNATGNYTFTFTNAMADTNYSVATSNNYTGGINSVIVQTYAKTTTTFSIYIGYVSNTGGGCTLLSYGLDFAVFGN